MRIGDRLAGAGAPESAPELDACPDGFEQSALAVASSRALTILDAVMLALAAALAQATASLTDLSAATGAPLLLFSFLCFALCTSTRRLLTGVAPGVQGLGELVFVPVLTGVAAAVLAVMQMPVLGAAEAARESARPWLLATAYVLAGRAAFGWAATGSRVVAVSEVIDRAAKRAFDVVLASALLLLATPLFVLVAAAITLEDRGPVLFRCRRIGEGGRELWMLKFRKMRREAGGPPLTSCDDPRFTRVGRFLAASKLDEVPQLWNVLRGEMSLVGPRPEDPWFVAIHPDRFEQILQSKPGVTGLCQLAFANEHRTLDATNPVRDYAERLLPQKIEIDLLYAKRRSLHFDARILLWTFVAVLFRKDVAVHRETGELTLRRRPSGDGNLHAT